METKFKIKFLLLLLAALLTTCSTNQEIVFDEIEQMTIFKASHENELVKVASDEEKERVLLALKCLQQVIVKFKPRYRIEVLCNAESKEVLLFRGKLLKYKGKVYRMKSDLNETLSLE